MLPIEGGGPGDPMGSGPDGASLASARNSKKNGRETSTNNSSSSPWLRLYQDTKLEYSYEIQYSALMYRIYSLRMGNRRRDFTMKFLPLEEANADLRTILLCICPGM